MYPTTLFRLIKANLAYLEDPTHAIVIQQGTEELSCIYTLEGTVVHQCNNECVVQVYPTPDYTIVKLTTLDDAIDMINESLSDNVIIDDQPDDRVPF